MTQREFHSPATLRLSLNQARSSHRQPRSCQRSNLWEFLLGGLTLFGLLGQSAEPLHLPAFPPVTPADRIVIVAPHPDDDVLGAGGLIQQAVAVGADVRVVYFTNGDHNQIAFKLFKPALHLNAKQYIEFGERRRTEAITATKLLGLDESHLTFLGYPDAGTLRMWRDDWEAGDIFTSDATRTNAVPYPADYAYLHPYKPQNIAADFTAVLRRLKPTRVFVTHPADTNPDHRAAANFVRLALLELAKENLRPTLGFYIIHFGSWPRPVHYHPEQLLEPPVALLDDGDWQSLPVTLAQAELKYRAILQHRTQITTRQYFLESFARANELFAGIPPDRVPVIPVNQKLRWRTALRANTLTVRPVDGGPTSALALDRVSFLRQGTDLLALIQLKNRLGKRSGIHLYLFPYRAGTAFAAMPKVEINLSPFNSLHVYVGGQFIREHAVTYESISDRLILRLPLALLGGGDIDQLFTSASAHFGEIAADDTAWQLLDLRHD